MEWPGTAASELLSLQTYIERRDHVQHNMQPENRFRYHQLNGTMYTLWDADSYNNNCLLDCIVQFMLCRGKAILVLKDIPT